MPASSARRAPARRPPGRPRGDLGTRERVLDRAVFAFAERGLEGISLRELASRAGLTHASLLHHFSSKQALYGAVLERVATSLAVWAEPPETGPLAERLRRVADAYLAWSVEHELYARILMRELLENRERAARARRFYLAPVVGRMVATVERAERDGEVERLDAEMVVVLVVGAVAYFVAAAPTLARILPRGNASADLERFRVTVGAAIDAIVAAHAPRLGSSSSRARARGRRPSR